MKNKRRYILGIFVLFLLLVPSVSSLYLNDLEDVNTDTAISCNILHYNGINWTNYDLWNETITWYKNHTFINNITANYFFGNGSFLTGITASLPNYLTRKGHPHNQDLNTTSNVNFNSITANNYYGQYHPHDQDTNTYADVLFHGISFSANQPDIFMIQSRDADTWIGNDIYRDLLILHNTGETSIPYQSSARITLRNNANINSGSWIKLRLDNVNYDLNNDFDIHHQFFTVPLNGLYQICYSIYIFDIPDRIQLGGCIYVNGIQRGATTMIQSSCISVTDLCNSGSDILYLYRGDYIELFVYQNSGVVKIFPPYTYSNYLAICKIA